MAILDRWRSGKDIDRFRLEFDDLLERFGLDRAWFGRFPFGREAEGEGSVRPALETRVEEGKFIVRTDLPGIDPKNIDVKIVGDVLTIKGTREEKTESKKADFFRREIRYGAFERSVSIPEGIKADELKATYRDGVLEITAPMPQEKTPKEVKIQIEGSK
jgi:HSP20 family protein